MKNLLMTISLLGGMSILSAQDLNACGVGNHEDLTTQDGSSSIRIPRSEIPSDSEDLEN